MFRQFSGCNQERSVLNITLPKCIGKKQHTPEILSKETVACSISLSQALLLIPQPIFVNDQLQLRLRYD